MEAISLYFFGLNPGTTRDDILQCLKNWDKGDNGILYLSRAYKLQLGTGWNVPPEFYMLPGLCLLMSHRELLMFLLCFKILSGIDIFPGICW